MFQAAATAAALMERTPFAIDDAKDDEDETDDESDVEDDGVMDEVDAFLEAHDSGLTEAERELAQGMFSEALTLNVVLTARANRPHPRGAG